MMRQFAEEEIQQANNPKKRCSAILLIKNADLNNEIPFYSH